ncbi:hypothetical protein [Nocardia arthritidis]|uniref:DUF732 domain-containing protein n=1 Tax=Nocardia arthritidis TaxID=228602 RepID=A0A6G9YQ33_9NOCA|nr:hypothetical protein [Nocardia arthritidis]QIS15197.1 hypothetical protein F5544_36845 [Nocardia arthritidis]
MRARQLVVVLFGASLLTLGTVVLDTATTAAAPAVVQVDTNYPLDGKDTPGNPPKKDEKAEKAEKFGGKTTNSVIDLITGVIKCAFNIATNSIKCPL